MTITSYYNKYYLIVFEMLAIPTYWELWCVFQGFLRRLCTKVVNLDTKAELKGKVAETLVTQVCELPLAYFDVMVHLTVHLVEELIICGLVQTRWMYPFERYYKGLKGFVRNLARPQGSFARGYEIEEALGFLT